MFLIIPCFNTQQLPSISLEPEPADLEVNGQPLDKENIISFKGLNLLDVTAPPEPRVFGRVLCSKMWGPFGLTEARFSLGKGSKEPDVNPYDKEVFKRKVFKSLLFLLGIYRHSLYKVKWILLARVLSVYPTISNSFFHVSELILLAVAP